ncbi:MAG: O-antigen ligase family protein [bacterium]|nr:O-antigen ligase family protein [bacterium]
MNATLRQVLLSICILFPVFVFTSIALSNLTLGLIVFLFFLLDGRDEFPKQFFPIWLLIVYIVIQFLSTFFSPIASNWSSWIEEMSVFAALIPGFVVGKDKQRLERSLFLLGLLVVILSIYSVYQYFYGWDLLRGRRPLLALFHRYHATGLQDFYLTFAGLMGLAFPLVGLTTRYVFLPLAFTIACGIGVLATMARSMILGLLFGSIVTTIFGSKKQKIIYGISFVCIILFMFSIFSATGERLSYGLEVTQKHQPRGDPTRIELWHTSMKIIRDYPILGIGNNNWNTVFEKYRKKDFSFSSTAHPHNDYLSTAVEYGIGALLVFLLFWVIVLYHLFQKWRNSSGDIREWNLGFLVSIIILLIGSVFQNYQTDAENALFLWFIVGAALRFEG